MASLSKRSNSLEKLLEISSVERLEAAVGVASDLLTRLKASMASATPESTQAAYWEKRIDTILSEKQRNPTIIAVLGGTGAGKSSVINALLDEKRLVPTNCVRACTACATEISWNHSEDPYTPYRAEIEFVSAEAWRTELEILFGDILDHLADTTVPSPKTDTEAGVAYSKITGVYPDVTRSSLRNHDPMQLANRPDVAKILGTTKHVGATTSSDLYEQLQPFVDSKEKSGDKKMEFWPLVKVVRIFTKALVLSSGATIVDLPGTADANPARAAIATQYLRKATSLWIVAPITRAVDDSTAKNLLGTAFRRQVQCDGNISAISFICSKIDDISIQEACENFDLQEFADISWAKIHNHEEEAAKLKAREAELRNVKEQLKTKQDQNKLDLEVYQLLREQIVKGGQAYAPDESRGKKRCRGSNESPDQKRLKLATVDPPHTDATDTTSSESSSEDEESFSESTHEQSGKPLSLEEAKTCITSLRDQKKSFREQKKAVEAQISDIKGVLAANKLAMEAINMELHTACISARNEYATDGIKRDFADGVKELDDMAALDREDDDYDFSQDTRDYHQVAESLPVFCCSARAYQKKCAKLSENDLGDHGFPTLDDTGIPDLQNHALLSSEPGRKALALNMLSQFVRLITPMQMWHSGVESLASREDREKWQTCLDKNVRSLDNTLISIVEEFVASITEALQHNIYRRFDRTIVKASRDAVGRAIAWGLPRKEGGMLYKTYKATCRRNGVFHGTDGPRDLNLDLLDPIMQKIGATWDKVFSRKVPSALRNFSMECVIALETFHKLTIEIDSYLNDSPAAAELGEHMAAHKSSFDELSMNITILIGDLQRDASRQFAPVIQALLQQAYHHCNHESGKDAYKRIKAYMISHIDSTRHNMFHQSTGHVRGLLYAMCRAVEKNMSERIHDIVRHISNDYRTAIGSCDREATQALRAEISPVLSELEMSFAGVLLDTSNGPDADAVKGDD